jgi:regulator of replication initiation timing
MLMASYIEWNQALVEYFTKSVSQGARVYLSVDDDVLERIGRQLGASPKGGSWCDDFCQAVRQRIGINSSSGGNTVNLDEMRNSFSTPPICVAFLGLMVLAAYEMDRDESSNVNANNYYRRLREILNLTTSEFSAPKGMNLHHELWVKWNKWLNDNGFLSTACQGNTQPTKYINYPISQSVLRKADKEKIYKLAQEQGLQNHWNIDSLMTYLCSNTESLTRHLKKLLDENQRFEVIKKAVQDALDDEKAIQDKAVREKISTSTPRFTQNGAGWQKPESNNKDRVQNGQISAQIYRSEGDYFFSQYPDFFLGVAHLKEEQVKSG